MSDNKTSIFGALFGGSPIRVIIKLAIVSILVGLVLSVFGITPRNIFYFIDDALRSLYDLGFGAVTAAFEYLLLGAVIVVPIWLLMRLLSPRNK